MGVQFYKMGTQFFGRCVTFQRGCAILTEVFHSGSANFRGVRGILIGKVPKISKLYTPALFLGRSHPLKSQLACLHLHNQYAGLVQMWDDLVGCFPHQDQLHPHYILPVLVLDICQLKFKTFKIMSLFK